MSGIIFDCCNSDEGCSLSSSREKPGPLSVFAWTSLMWSLHPPYGLVWASSQHGGWLPRWGVSRLRVRILHVTQPQRTCIITSFILCWVEQSQNSTHLHGRGHRPCHSIARVSVNHIVKRAESKICPKDHASFFFVSQHLSSQWKATDAQSVHFLNCIKLSKFDI